MRNICKADRCCKNIFRNIFYVLLLIRRHRFDWGNTFFHLLTAPMRHHLKLLQFCMIYFSWNIIKVIKTLLKLYQNKIERKTKAFNQLHVFFNFWVFETSTDQSFCGIKSVRRVCDSLTLSRGTDQSFSIFSESYMWRCRSATFAIFNYLIYKSKIT